MSNRHVQELMNVWLHLVKDAAVRYPALQDEFDRDIVRLQNSVEQRGIGVFVTDLPALGKHLDRCLSIGEYIASDLPLSKMVSKAVKIPKFLRGVYLLVFHSNGCLKGDLDHEAVFFLRQLLNFGKKTSLPCPAAAVSHEVRDFAAVDSGLPRPCAYWSDPAPSPTSYSRATRKFREAFGTGGGEAAEVPCEDAGTRVGLLETLDNVSRILTATLGVYNPSEWRFKHGPGAVSDVKGPTNKFCWTNWSPRLERVFPIADYGFHSYASWARNIDTIVGEDEPYSRLIAVNKTFTRPRLIAAEPRENQWCQQNCWDYFSNRVAGSWIGSFISFRDQTLNQTLCLKGSLTGSLATVDLSSASDRLTPGVVGSFFSGNKPLVEALQSSRTRFMRQDICKDLPSMIELRKFSTMGSACTFPVQSLVFLGVAISTVLFRTRQKVTVSNIKKLIGKVAVFGDDIIIPSDCREDLQRLLEVLHFKVNTAKTFSEGNFRESCGVDAFRGECVTPIYWKGEIGSDSTAIASRIECANNFYSKFLLHTRSYVASTVPKGFPWVSARSSVAGLKSRVPVSIEARVRYNSDLQRDEALVSTCYGRVRKTQTNDDTSLFQFFVEEPSPMDEWSHGITERPDLRVRKRWVPVNDLLNQ